VPTFGSLFAGIGGIDLGLERAGWTGRWQVEWDDYCRRVLAKHWPDVARYGDVHDVHGRDACPSLLADAGEVGRLGWTSVGDIGRDATEWGEASDHAGNGRVPRGCPNCLEPVDLIAGGFPCQPFSFAGKQQRLADDRWLWPEFERCIRELRPRYVLVENVPGLLVGGGMDAVLGGLADLGYDAEWESIPAAAVGAPHLRYRVWIIGTRVAHADGLGQGRSPALGPSSLTGLRPQEAGAEPDGSGDGTLADADPGGWDGRAGELGPGWRGELADGGWWRTEPDVGRVAHGVPARVDRLRSLGNAVVPQVVEWIGRRIIEKEGLA
jgi:DNA (cytosine-5)-methyltransferase 1